MLRNLTEYHWADHIDDALFLLARIDTKTVPLAGGTSLLASNDDRVEAVVDLRDLELATIAEDARGIHIGPMATLQQIACHSFLSSFVGGIVAQAARVSSPSQAIRNSATLGGTLALGATSHADLSTVLTALDAQAVVRSGSRTEVTLNGGMSERSGSFLSGIVYKGKHERRLDCASVSRERLPNELIVDVVLPCLGQEMRGAFARISDTTAGVALLNVAFVADVAGEKWRSVRLVIGGGEMEPVRCIGVEQLLEGQQVHDSQVLDSALNKGMANFRPRSDRYAHGEYRKLVVISLVQQVCEAVAADIMPVRVRA
jgi:CO/xanthine dehydrogenase FAD-binding subunit